MQGSAAPRLLSIEEWADLDEDVEGEFVDGRVEEEEMPSILHEVVVSWLVCWLGVWVTPRGGFVLGSETRFRLSSSRGRKPDVAVYLPGRPLPARNAAATRRPPSIVIEVLSSRPRDVRRDVVEKKREYAAFGVPYYWIIDPVACTFEIFELGADGRYAVSLSAAEGEHPVPGCAELTLDLDALWARAERLAENEDD
jgi:Uma2 family endonuclease